MTEKLKSKMHSRKLSLPAACIIWAMITMEVCSKANYEMKSEMR